MRFVSRLAILCIAAGICASGASAQRPQDKPADLPKEGKKSSSSAAVDAIVARMMAFDKNMDGKLTREEITDERLLRLFDRADTNEDGVVTKEELTALAKRMVAEDAANDGARRGGFGPPDGPGGPGGPGGRRPGGPPQPGQILPPFLQEQLNLTDEQKKQLDSLQKEVDSKLGKILTDEQKKRLKEMRDRGPGGPPDGGGRPRRPDGEPPVRPMARP